jgi:hypothetical protein
MDGNGNAISAWQQLDSEGNYVVLAARFTPAGPWEEAQSIDSGTAEYESWPDVAMDPSGNAVVVWHGYDSQGDAGILANSYTLQEGWADAQPVNTPTDTGTAYWPDVDMDAEGNAIAVWVQADYEGDVWTERVWTSRFTQDGNWGTAESFETTDSSYPRDPHVSMNAGGVAMAVWQRIPNGGRYTIWSARYDPARGWDPQEQVDTDRGDQDYGYDPQVAVDPFGDALAVWQGGSADPHVKDGSHPSGSTRQAMHSFRLSASMRRAKAQRFGTRLALPAKASGPTAIATRARAAMVARAVASAANHIPATRERRWGV